VGCSICSVIQNKDTDANNFIKNKYSSTYKKYLEKAGLEEIAHKNVYSFVRNGELPRFGKDDIFERSCTCYICDKRGIKFDPLSDSMRQ
jgi:hypothetical protein